MKTKILITAAAMLVSYFSYAQCLVLHHEGEVLEPNATITVEGNASIYETVVELDVENTCGTDIDVLVQRYEQDMVPGSSSAFCWGVCFLPSVSLSPFSLTVPAGTIDTENFSGHYYPDGNEGVSTISYVLFDQNNPDDSVMVTVNYDCTLLDINENVVGKDEINVYPVPARDFVTLNIEDESVKLDFQILDVTGSLVKEFTQVSSGSTIRVNELAEGLYLYRAVAEGTLVKTGRLIVKR